MGELLELWQAYSSLVNGTLLLGILGVGLRHYILTRRVAIEEKRNDRDGYGDLIDRLETRVKALEANVASAEARTHELHDELAEAAKDMGNLRGHLAQALAGIRMLMDALEAKDPDDPALTRVSKMLVATFRDLEMPPLRTVGGKAAHGNGQ